MIIGKAEMLMTDCMDKPALKRGHWLVGRKHTDETKLKMREARLKNNPMHKPDVVAKRSATLIANGTFAKENNNKWKGGKTPEHLLLRNSPEMAEWKTAVFVRDEYACRHCGGKCGNGVDVYLHAHHIKRFSEFPELMFDVENGLTLCKCCHYKEHTK